MTPMWGKEVRDLGYPTRAVSVFLKVFPPAGADLSPGLG